MKEKENKTNEKNKKKEHKIRKKYIYVMNVISI